jgi:GxxExxY protein
MNIRTVILWYYHVEKDIVYPELSYKIVGVCMEVNDSLGSGHKERVYEQAIAQMFEEKGIQYERQVYVPILFHGKTVGAHRLDFLVEHSIVVELKRGDRFVKKDIDQLYQYLRVRDLKLGILIRFSSDGLFFKRVVNLT